MMSAEEKIVIRLYAKRDDDLLTWLATIPKEHGAKSVAVKAALRKGITSGQAQETTGVPFDAQAFLDTLLPPIRRLVENAIQSELAKVQWASTTIQDEGSSADDDIDQQLDDLGNTLMS